MTLTYPTKPSQMTDSQYHRWLMSGSGGISDDAYDYDDHRNQPDDACFCGLPVDPLRGTVGLPHPAGMGPLCGRKDL